jgi:uncharacterized protein YoxC
MEPTISALMILVYLIILAIPIILLVRLVKALEYIGQALKHLERTADQLSQRLEQR